jgi:hypothetical protein
MGWLFRCGSTRKGLIEERIKGWERTKSDCLLITSRCLAHCFRGGAFSGVLWSVWERTFTGNGEEAEPTQRWIQCDLLRHQRDYGWGYKDMEESCGPYYYSCPLKYLRMVPVEQYGGNGPWREQVYEYHEIRKARRQQRTPTIST